MEKEFKKLLEKAKGWKNQTSPVLKTFEGAIFKDSSWYLDLLEPKVSKSLKTEQKSENIPSISPSRSYKTLVYFVGDSYDGAGDDLLGKMIAAMKLSGSEFGRYPFDEKLEDIENLAENLKSPSHETKNLLSAIEENAPRVIVSLGATTTNILLGRREKLSSIHGQLFDRTFNGHNCQLLPLFHPDFLKINPNMKRTAWIDLQKVMECIGKN